MTHRTPPPPNTPTHAVMLSQQRENRFTDASDQASCAVFTNWIAGKYAITAPAADTDRTCAFCSDGRYTDSSAAANVYNIQVAAWLYAHHPCVLSMKVLRVRLCRL